MFQLDIEHIVHYYLDNDQRHKKLLCMQMNLLNLLDLSSHLYLLVLYMVYNWMRQLLNRFQLDIVCTMYL